MAVKKQMKTVDQLITHMKNKGVAFSIISEADAKLHLDMHNNYFKLTSYRKNYTKTTTGPNAGKYENLEFAHLIELARLDTEIRHLLLQMTLDVEHFMKVALIKAVEDRMDTVGDEDGYKIIEGYLLADDIQSISEKSQTMAKRNRQFSQKINQNKHNPYCEGLIDRYSEEMPIWAFVELGSFGDLKELVEYTQQKQDGSHLLTCRVLIVSDSSVLPALMEMQSSTIFVQYTMRQRQRRELLFRLDILPTSFNLRELTLVQEQRSFQIHESIKLYISSMCMILWFRVIILEAKEYRNSTI